MRYVWEIKNSITKWLSTQNQNCGYKIFDIPPIGIKHQSHIGECVSLYIFSNAVLTLSK